MRFSRYFIPTLRDIPAEATIASHRLMLRAGLVSQTASGIFSWLPLGFKVLQKIEAVIDEEQQKIGASRICMSTIQPADFWRESGRYDSYGKEMLRIKDRKDGDFLFSPTSEEQVTDIFRKYIKSYKQLPVNLYQIQWKFRDEIRPRFGVMRGREFLMKDGYSFNLTYETAKQTYKDEFNSYLKIFKKLGLVAVPVQAVSGAIGGNMSNEFHVLADTGESKLYYDKNVLSYGRYDEFENAYAVSDEKYDKCTCPIPENEICISRGIEVGHIFYFGKKYSASMNAYVLDSNGEKLYPEMGSYGIGVSRLVAAIIESSHDNKGIIWPVEVAPFAVEIVSLQSKEATCVNTADSVYNILKASGVEILYDNREISAGEKLNDADLIGIPYQVLVGKRGISKGIVEVKNRKTGEIIEVSIDGIVNFDFDKKL